MYHMNQYHHLNFLLHNCQWSLDQWHLLPLQTRGWRCSHRFSPILVFSCICKSKKEQISGVSLWKHVWSGWERFPKHARFIVEVGIQIPFWHVRCVDVCLKSPFPDLFAISVNCCEILKYSQVYEPYRSIVGQEWGRTHRDLNGRRKIKFKS